jgi:release factor glutamine methyltransferase
MLKQDLKVWTIRELMRRSIDHLQQLGFDEARLTIELLLSHALNCQRIALYSQSEKRLTKDGLNLFLMLYERRLAHEPVQYIIGSAAFMGLQFVVDPRVLIPRPETETLVEQALMVCNDAPNDRTVNILEVGTGCGNIAVSLAKFSKRAAVTSFDNSPGALEIARTNIASHGVEDRVVLHDLDAFEPIDQLLRRRFEILVSNPPYISAEEWVHLQPEVRDYEPRDATCDGADGYELHRRIIELAPYVLNDNGTLLLEVADGQAMQVMAMMSQSAFHSISVIDDLQGVQRVVRGSVYAKSRSSIPFN